MKKLYFILGVISLSTPAILSAQDQLPNSGFEEEWIDCVPWTSKGNTQTCGQMPQSWTISHVIGMNGLGATEVGQKVEGYESEAAVSLTNNSNPFMAQQIVPGYLTLGTPWNTSVLVSEKDGGTFGGIEFTQRPKAISFRYKRSHGTMPEGDNYPETYNAEEPATVVAYLWKGTYTQADVPAEIGLNAALISKTNMVDRDRNILGMETAKGGEVTKTEDAECIAKIIYSIEGDTEEWKELTIPFEYLSDATPEKINVIFAAGDYFETTPYKGNNLVVDDVKLVYAEETDADKYPGKLTINMFGDNIAENVDAEIQIAYASESSCTISLPNFALSLDGGEPAVLGDIVVPNVAISIEDNVAHYTGSVTGLSLAGGEIVADAVVNGTIDSAGKATFKIDVTWNSIPIYVTFNGNGKPAPGLTGIGSITNDSAEAEYYNLQGMRANSANLAPGIYIKRQGDKTTKVIIR